MAMLLKYKKGICMFLVFVLNGTGQHLKINRKLYWEFCLYFWNLLYELFLLFSQ